MEDVVFLDEPGQGPSREELLGRYAAYRRRQVRGLLRVVPREAIRPLYRSALAAGHGVERAVDPMETLLSHCEDLLPLPPFEIWLEDVARHPEEHLREVDDAAEAPGADAPVTMETRRFRYGGRPWDAHLRSFCDGPAWRGFISFEDRRSRRVHRTALIFREPDPAEVRDRFMSFEVAALRAFLRSALP